MKKGIVVLAVVGVVALSLVVGVFASDFVWQDISRGNLNLNTVLVEHDNPRNIYIGSERGIFKSEDGGEIWRSIFSARGASRGVNLLLFGSDDKNSLYAATGNGLYFSYNQGRNWSRLFKGKNHLENECIALAVLPQAIYLGTKAGLFVSNDQGRSWHKEAGKIDKASILAIAYNPKEPNYIYVASVAGVFKSVDAGQSWERIFVTHPVENTDDKDEVNEDQDEEERLSDIRYISIDPNNLNYLYLATSGGVYKSQDRGKTWELLSSYGLLDREVRFLLVSPDSIIYAITSAGIFRYERQRWHELSLGLPTRDISLLYLDKQGNLYAACDQGLFKTGPVAYSNINQDGRMLLYYRDEPQIKGVQDAAIKYAEVTPEKITHWRKLAARKACLPRLTAGVDRDTSDLWHWESGSTTRSGDDVLVRGRGAVSWDVTLTWDLSELIWNDAQTAIDVRSRLMVQLRGDVLDEVTKLYFERIRVKMELDNLSIEDRKKRFEKELKLQELTAQIDGLTGGYFSSQIK